MSRSSRLVRGLVLMLMASASLNIWTGWTLRKQQAAHQEATSRLLLGVGATVEPFVGTLADGRGVVLDSSDGSTFILYAMSPTCPACKTNQPHIAELAKRMEGRGVPIYFVQAEDLRPAQARTPIVAPKQVGVITKPERKSLQQYRIGATPQTVVVRAGRIVSAWVGTYDGENRGKVESLDNLGSAAGLNGAR